jgi:hypothetical protein
MLCGSHARVCSKMELKPLLCLVLCALCSLARCAGAACSDCDILHTGFFSVSKPTVSLAAGASREGTTRIRLELCQGQVSSSMPVVTVTQGSQEGLRHNVVHTWQFLQVRWLTCRKLNNSSCMLQLVQPNASNRGVSLATACLYATAGHTVSPPHHHTRNVPL